MTHDPLYQRIIAGLDGRLDPDLFEDCATDLLRTVYPGLVPVRGGNDAGMDGAVADGGGTAYPLVCTTGENVIGNLRGSLLSYINKRGTRRNAISATSQSLTPARRRNLEKAAAELGFTLIGIHDQTDFANRLYRDSKWCMELLGLPHDPPPLSVLPRTFRLVPTARLIGRDGDLDWLRNTGGDLLLSGQPGMGKTALLADLARTGDGLFVVTLDMGRIMAGVREQQPPALLVDDAHLRTELLAELRAQREETGAEFRIVADCWPGEVEAVARALGVTSRSIRQLEPLTRKEIAEVIRGRGIGGPNSLLRELIRQADGRPGLAVTLCDICVREDTTRSVVLGDALARDVRTTFESLVGHDAVTALACFAVGGEGGMHVSDVARYLGLPLARVHEVVTGLAAGGVLVVAEPQRLVVRPEPLRHALVRDVFFAAPAALRIEDLLPSAPFPSEATRTLIGARARGGRVPQWLLVERVGAGANDRTWLEFTFLGTTECRWVMDNHPLRFRAIAEAALERTPQEAVDHLLAEAGSPDGAWASTLLEHWVAAARPGTGEAIRRRRLVALASTRCLSAGGNLSPALRSACAALSPRFGEWDSDPAERYRMVHRFGLLTDAEMTEVQGLWQGVRDRLGTVATADWRPVQELYRAWAYPGLAQVEVSRETVAAMTAFAARLLEDLARLWRNRPGLLHWAWQMTEVHGAKLAVPLDPDFVTLYPFRDRGDLQERLAREQAAVRALATRWASEPPKAVAVRLAEWESEVATTRTHAWPRWGPIACEEIAARVTDPGEWEEVFGAAGLSGDLVGPFLARAAVVGEVGWGDRLVTALARPSSEGAAVAIVLGLPVEPPTHLWSMVWDRLPRFTNLVLMLRCNQMPEARVELLLRHPDPKVAAEVAMAEWHSEPAESVRPGLATTWRDAVVRGAEHVPDAAWEMFPNLARDWLAARFNGQDRHGWPDLPPYPEVFDRLSVAERAELLDRVPTNEYWASGVIYLLVGDDAELYRRVLADPRLVDYHLAPLEGHPDAKWRSKAELALAAGHEPERVALAAFREHVPYYFGGEVERWRDWPDAFAALEADPDRRMRVVGAIGRERAERRMAEARREERHDEVYGDD